MQTRNPLLTIWVKLQRVFASPLDSFCGFYLGLESTYCVADPAEEMLNADPLSPVATAVP
jgi:hypothetical protein